MDSAQPNINRRCLRNISPRKSQPLRVNFYETIGHRMRAPLLVIRRAKYQKGVACEKSAQERVSHCGLTSNVLAHQMWAWLLAFLAVEQQSALLAKSQHKKESTIAG